MQYPAYTYEGVEVGFAEQDLEEYDPVADAVAWGRSLQVVRRGFGAEVELERGWEENVEGGRIPFPQHKIRLMVEGIELMGGSEIPY
jgi:hypothetical protein